jgi:hypothetical protein
MADRIVMLGRDDGSRSREIIEAFAQRTGLEAVEIDGGAEFAVSGEDHRVPVVQTLNEIDPGWAEHLALGDPE